MRTRPIQCLNQGSTTVVSRIRQQPLLEPSLPPLSTKKLKKPPRGCRHSFRYPCGVSFLEFRHCKLRAQELHSDLVGPTESKRLASLKTKRQSKPCPFTMIVQRYRSPPSIGHVLPPSSVVRNVTSTTASGCIVLTASSGWAWTTILPALSSAHAPSRETTSR